MASLSNFNYKEEKNHTMIMVEHLTKYYGSHLAVDDVSFTITDGHVYGFLGPNGAGKSTTMNILTGCLSATGGQVTIDGHDIFEEPKAAKQCIGYLPEHPPLYLHESPLEYLRFVAEAKGLRGPEREEQVALAMEKTGITAVKHRRISALSKGYKQRVGIAQALLGNPKVIVLDEPTVGLDPIQILEIRELIRELGKTHTVIFSSHILSEVQAICDRILMIARGKLVAFGTPEELQKQLAAPGEIQLITNAAEHELYQILPAVGVITEIRAESLPDGRTRARIFSDQEDMDAVSASVFRAMADNGKMIYEMNVKKGSLEELFLELSEAVLVEEKEEEL